MTATPAPPAGAPAGLLALLDRLDALAQKATPGPWMRLAPEDNYDCHSNIDTTVVTASGANVLGTRVLCEVNRYYPTAPDDAEFIAACSPSTILALLTAARRGAETMQQQEQQH